MSANTIITDRRLYSPLRAWQSHWRLSRIKRRLIRIKNKAELIKLKVKELKVKEESG